MVANDSAIFPITIGIIGHRDFNDSNYSVHEEQLTNILDSIISQNPNSKVVVISSFAEGADRLGVKVASALNLEIIALLPMPQNEYERDFDLESLKEFRHLLELATTVKINSAESTLSRDDLYESCAMEVVKLSDFCVAFWDGKVNSLVGGTSSTVEYLVNKQSSGSDGSAIIHLDMPRSKQSSEVINPKIYLQSAWVEISKEVSDYFKSEKDQWNKEVTKYLDNEPDSIKTDYFRIVDALATRLQIKFKVRLRLLAISLYLSVLLVEAFLLFQGHILAVIMTSVVGATFFYWRLFTRSRLKAKYESLRFLGESLRLDKMLSDSGINYSVSEVASRNGKADDDWVIGILRWIHFYQKMPDSNFTDAPVVEWVQGQIRYLEGGKQKPGSIERNSKNAARLVTFSRISLGFSMLALLLVLVTNFFPITPPDVFPYLTSMFWTVGLASFASIVAYLEVTAVRDITARYKDSLTTFKSFEKRINQSEALHSTEIQRMADTTFTELSFWYSLKRERKVRPIQ